MNGHLEKVSIIIPAYNASNYLREAIECALNQTYENIEVIVVNDGSKDDGATREVALSYGDKIRYFEKENGGSSSALNYGVDRMTGEWFSWLSHDDLYREDKVKKQVDFLRDRHQNGEDVSRYVLFSACEMIDQSGKVIRPYYAPKEQEKATKINTMGNNHWLIADQIKKYTFHGCSCLIHRSVFDQVGKFDESLRYVNDIDMWLRIFKAGYKVHYLPDCLVQGRVHSKQVSRTIGFSYHNWEQDRYWNQVYEYLLGLILEPDWYDLLLTYAMTATEKTRWEDGKRAFFELKCAYPERIFQLNGMEAKCKTYGFLRTFAKKIYIKMFLRC